MQVFESFDSFLNEGQNPDWYYLFKQIGGRNVERKPAYMQDLFGRSTFVKMKDSQVDDLSVANIPVYTSKDIWGKMEPKYGPATEFKNTPGETIFIIFFNHEQGEMKDYYGMSAFVNTEGAKYMRYAFGFDFEPDLSSFAMGVPESLENEVEVEGEIAEAKGYNMEDIRYAMQQVFSEVGFDKALKAIKKVKGGFQMNMSSYMSPSSLEGYGMINAFSEIMGHEFTMDADSFKKGSVTSIVILESNNDTVIDLVDLSELNEAEEINEGFKDKLVLYVSINKSAAEQRDEKMRKYYTANAWALSEPQRTKIREALKAGKEAIVVALKGKEPVHAYEIEGLAAIKHHDLEPNTIDKAQNLMRTVLTLGKKLNKGEYPEKKYAERLNGYGVALDEAFEINEGKITVKRKYTEAYPQITVAKFAPIRDRIIEAIADGKISKEQFETIIKEFSNSSKKWARRNTHYFNVSEDGIALSKYGKRILAKIKPVNENE